MVSVPFEAREVGPSSEEAVSDPVVHFESFLVDHDLLLPEEQKQISERIDSLIRQESQRALEAPFPGRETIGDELHPSTAPPPARRSF